MIFLVQLIIMTIVVSMFGYFSIIILEELRHYYKCGVRSFTRLERFTGLALVYRFVAWLGKKD